MELPPRVGGMGSTVPPARVTPRSGGPSEMHYWGNSVPSEMERSAPETLVREPSASLWQAATLATRDAARHRTKIPRLPLPAAA